MCFTLFVVLTLIIVISGINSLSFVSDVSVPSDVLIEVFLEEIQQNPNKVYESAADYGRYNSQKCLFSLREIIKHYPSHEVASFFDVWGNIPVGITSGNGYDRGNYDQCVKSSLTFNELTGIIKQQYCFATLPIKNKNLREIDVAYWSFDQAINIGICVPDTCSPELLTSIFQESTKTSFYGALSEIFIGRCVDGNIPSITAYNIAGIMLLVLLTVLMILSSAYDLYASHYQKKPITALLTFSIFKNGKILFAIDTKQSANTIDCLTGIRVLATLWTMNHHKYTNVFEDPVIKNLDLDVWLYSWEFMSIFNGTTSLDTFFFMSGLLVAWVGFKNKTHGKKNILVNIVHRYIRLTPVLAAALVLTYSVNRFLYTEPVNACNRYNWWPVLILRSNSYIADTKCYNEAWYLSLDFQLYALSPLILVPMSKLRKKFAPVLLVLGIILIGWVLEIFFSESYTGVDTGEGEQVYTPTLTRYAPWLIGLVFGYFMHKNRQSQFQLSKTIQIIGWIASFCTMTAIIVFGQSFALQAISKVVIYEGFKRVLWTLAQVWITFACHYGYGGFVNTFLAHPLWQPLGRLSYAMYMMHMAIMQMNFGMARTEIYFSFLNQFLFFWVVFGVTLLVAIYVTLAFDSPFLVLENIIFRHNKVAAKEYAALAYIVVDSATKDL